MNATQQFARASGYTGSSPAMLAAFERIRIHGVTEARAAHYERIKLVEKYKAEPGMFFAAIRPSLSTEEYLDDSAKLISNFRNLPSWQQGSRRPGIQQAKEMRVVVRFFRRYGKRLWLMAAA